MNSVLRDWLNKFDGYVWLKDIHVQPVIPKDYLTISIISTVKIKVENGGILGGAPLSP